MGLTADVDAGLERSVDVWIHLDVEVLLLGHGGVAICYLLPDPVGEVVTDDGIGDIAQPRSRNLENVSLVWNVSWGVLVLIDLLEDLLHPETVVLRDVEDLDIVALDARVQMNIRQGTYWRFFPCMRSLRK